jgi:hypothetical protein
VIASLRTLRERPLPAHALLFAAFPPLFLYASNVGERIAPVTVFAQLALVVAASALLVVLWTVVLGHARRAALVVSLWAVLFFTYGHAWNVLRSQGGAGWEAWLLALWAALAVAAAALAARAGRWLVTTTRGLNAAALALVALNLATVVAGAVGGGNSTAVTPGGPIALGGKGRPDVYYIVMDRYGSAETLRKRFGFDNTPFLGDLERRGFYVAGESMANYPKTSHSLAASLNLGYLGFLTEAAGPGSDDWNPVYGLLREFRAARALQAAGYTYVHIGSRWDPTSVDPAADVNEVSSGMSEFAQVLYGSTLLSPLARHTGVLAESLDPRERERRRILFQFDRLAAAHRSPGPTFVFAHVLLPHEPYLFEADGDPVTDVEDAERSLGRKFIDQVRYANRRLLDLLDVLLSGPPENRPIILLQADEGPHPQGYLADEVHYEWTRAPTDALQEKLGILNAYYLPGVTDAGRATRLLYPTISPVNSFRVVFNEYFNAGLALLPDRSYVFVDEEHLYDFVDVTARVRDG